MDFTYMGKILLSATIFAPGLILLAGALVVGALMLVEKSGVLQTLGQAVVVTKPAATETLTGSAGITIVDELKASINSERSEKHSPAKRV